MALNSPGEQSLQPVDLIPGHPASRQIVSCRPGQIMARQSLLLNIEDRRELLIDTRPEQAILQRSQ